MTAATSDTSPARTTKETHPNLPPGLILGPDGKPCKVCNTWQDWAKLKVKKSEGHRAPNGGSSAAVAAGGISLAVGTSTIVDQRETINQTPSDRSDCPPDTADLGRATWTFLHTTAAYYPLAAPPAVQTKMRALLSSISTLYPCTWCAEDFTEQVRAHPPDVSGREGLSRWLCERHNEVNEKLGKARFECSWDSLNRRWKDGPQNGTCD